MSGGPGRGRVRPDPTDQAATPEAPQAGATVAAPPADQLCPPAAADVPQPGPSSRSLAEDEEEFFCYTYKIKSCPLRTPHDWQVCG
jgi:hypothetical protein